MSESRMRQIGIPLGKRKKGGGGGKKIRYRAKPREWRKWRRHNGLDVAEI